MIDDSLMVQMLLELQQRPGYESGYTPFLWILPLLTLLTLTIGTFALVRVLYNIIRRGWKGLLPSR